MVLTGTPGVGKTQLAAAYARARLADGWRVIAWIDAQNIESVLAGLAAVAGAILVSDGGSWRSPADAGQAVRHWLESDGDGCLLVFDDAQDPDALRPFVPANGAARVLITAALQTVAELGARIPVNIFTREEAQALLAGRSGLADEAGAAVVAAELGRLPLGLDQAAGVIASQHLSYAAYLAQLRALPVEQYQAPEKEQAYPKGIAEAVLLSLVAVHFADQTGVCAGVMEVMAVLSSAAVRRDMLLAAAEAGILAKDGRRVAASLVDQALGQLEEHALLGFSLDHQTVIVHRLVARVVRQWLASRGRLTTACRAAASVLGACAEALPQARDRGAVRDLLGQITALLETGRTLASDAGEEVAVMLMRSRFLALYHLIELGDSMPQAIAVGESLTSDLEQLLGPAHADTLNAGNTLAGVYHAAGRTADAIPLLQHVLSTREQLFGLDHPSTLASRNNLATAYRAMGRAAQAIPLFEENVLACERLLGADHPKTAASRHNLDLARRDAGQAAN